MKILENIVYVISQLILLGCREIGQGGGKILPYVSPNVSSKFVSSKLHQNRSTYSILNSRFVSNIGTGVPSSISHTSFDPENSGSPTCISTSMQPRLQTSMARSYGIPSRTSGDR